VRTRDALAQIERRLAAAGVDTPRVDAEWLVAAVLRVSRTDVQLHDEVDAGQLEPLVRRREQREPLAYVLGEWGFRRLTLKTDRRALVPRPESEIVVERALVLIRDLDEARVLDLGTGTGAIALAIKDEHPRARVTGVDTSADAVALAQENADRLGLDVELRVAGIEAAREGWQLVVANPPYVRPEEWESLQPEIREWEPRSALVGDGIHEVIAGSANTRFLVVEVGDGQAQSVAAALAELGYGEITISRDLTGIDRVVEAERR
jgi:release factor glutamine methyltransferase